MEVKTKGIPYHYDSYFKNNSAKKAEFLKDYKLAVVYLVNRMALNPHGYASQSIGSASANYARWIPRECEVLMRKWGTPKSVVRDGGPFRITNKPYTSNINQQYLKE